MKATLLLGSGVSYHSGIPKIEEITNEILYAKNIGKYNLNYLYEGRYGFKVNPHYNYYTVQCQELIKMVKAEIAYFTKHISYNHSVNYEDIYYVLWQIYNSYYKDYENPALFRAMQYLFEQSGLTLDDFKESLKETLSYIESIVWQRIDIKIETCKQYDIISDLSSILEINAICTLNHDLVLDKWLENNKIDFDDGFSLLDSKFPEWQGFDPNYSKLKICKLHGSVNWYEVRVIKPITSDKILKIPNHVYCDSLSEIDENILASNKELPELLIGTFNKMWGYLSGIFEHQYDEFKKSLAVSELLLVSGYGFGDKGINTRLTFWLANSKSKKLIIIHPSKSELIENARGSFHLHILGERFQNPKVEIIEMKFEDVSVDDITKCI